MNRIILNNNKNYLIYLIYSCFFFLNDYKLNNLSVHFNYRILSIKFYF